MGKGDLWKRIDFPTNLEISILFISHAIAVMEMDG
jgi:hypothetical protein